MRERLLPSCLLYCSPVASEVVTPAYEARAITKGGDTTAVVAFKPADKHERISRRQQAGLFQPSCVMAGLSR